MTNTTPATTDADRAAAHFARLDASTMIEGRGWVPALTEVTTRHGLTVRTGDTVTGPDVTNGPVLTGRVTRIMWVHPGTGEVRARVEIDGGRTRVVAVDTVHTAPVLPDGVTTEPIGSGATEIVRLDGREVGDVVSDGPATRAMATMVGARVGTYRFATREDAITAVVSYARRGWWTGEI